MGRESGKKRKFQQEQRLAAEGATNKLQGEAQQQQQQQNGVKTASQLPPAEVERRKIQRELRELALKVKAAGGQYKPQKYKRKVYKEHGAELVGSNKAKKDKDRKKQRDTPSWRPYDKVDVVIIPIYWNIKSRLAEKEIVMRAASKVALLLRENSIDTHIDDANAYTPGQKMKYWETAGVLVRVEVGPKEAQNGTAVVALANEPGTVAAKETVNVDLQLMKEIRAKLEQAVARMGATGRAGKEERKRQKAQQQQLVQQQEQGEGGLGPQDDSNGKKQQQPQASSAKDDSETENQSPKGKKQRRQASNPEDDTGSGEGSEESEEGSDEHSGGSEKSGSGSEEIEESESEVGAEVRGDEGQSEGDSHEGEGEGSEDERQQQQQQQRQQQHRQQDSVPAKQVGGTVAKKKKEKHKGLEVANGGTQHKFGGRPEDVPAKQDQKRGKQASKPPQQQQQPKQQQQQQQQAPSQAPDIQGGVDELEDDFEIEPQFMPEPEEEEQTASKKDRLKQARKNDKAWRKQGRFGKEGAKAWDSTDTSTKTAGSAKKEKRPAKVVMF